MLQFLVLSLAGLAAGALNAVAGGGTFLSFPALVWLGVPPVMANATATLTALPGYVSSAWAFRRDVSAEGSLGLRGMLGLSVLGGFIGALLLMVTPDEVFSGVVPWLLLIATVLFALGPWLVQRLGGADGLGFLASALVLLVVSVYGGYFNGGLGIMLLAAFSLMGFANLHGMNGLKNALSAILSTVSALTLALAGLIEWDKALVLGIATALGGYLGGHYSRRIRNMRALRIAIVTVGLAMTVAFFLR
ncbi:sulfite exporter TauE/SafE family protein [Rhodobacteraceae bacterium DSL-40]|uniref:sulfite exporter TauE/SafE family protein n=1 Tax=Amaricoccus sp. B4 TaxID=3368557 RepID=UPI000DAB741D